MTAQKIDRSPIADAVEFNRELRTIGVIERIQHLSQVCIAKSVWAYAVNWIAVIACVMLVTKVSVLWSLIAIPIIGSRQRAMSNLVHDASHSNLFNGRELNDRIANLFAAYPMLDSVENYRGSHSKHHRFLGVPGMDPDLDNHLRYGFDDHNPSMEPAGRAYLRIVTNVEAWRDSLIGSFGRLSRREMCTVAGWWSAALLLGVMVDPSTAIGFVSLWWLSRATSYHLIRIFAEFLDHTGLKPGSIFGFTRNIPGGFWGLRIIFHPHSDNFHLVHHLLPQIPHYNLKAAHKAISKSKTYVDGHHCDGYFFGNYSAVKSWAGGTKT